MYKTLQLPDMLEIEFAIPSHFESPEFWDFYVKFPEIPEFFPEILCTQLICFKTPFTTLHYDETCYLVYYRKQQVS